MSSPAQVDGSIENTPEYDAFISKVRAFHNARGTNFDPSPKVGKKQVDLLKLYDRVTSEGGYDAVSDTKSNKLAWRKIGQDFRLGNSSDPTLAFTLKTAYYKNLVAYEIRTFHDKEPPPPAILEEVSAKGGNVLNRTVDNFIKPASREEIRLANGGNAQDGSEDDPEHKEEDGASGRATRGLRQAPPPRQMFTGEVNPRGTRISQPNGSPVPPYSAMAPAPAANVPQSLATYEPRPAAALPMRAVMTPGNNFDQFKADQKRIRDQALMRGSRTADMLNRGLILPGTGYAGPSIYIRTLLALQSGIIEEQEFALHHLVKISHERGDKYRFDSFPGLAEGLIKKLLEIGELVLDVEWSITYDAVTAPTGEAIVDVATGSSDILASVHTSKKRKRQDKLHPEMFSRRLTLINEAGLVMRNMVMLQDNAEHLSKYPIMRALLTVLLNLPSRPETAEVQHYGLELAEQLVGYLIPTEDDQLYHSLLSFVERRDRGVIISSLRSICRLGSYRQRTIPLINISTKIIQRLCSWIFIEDEDLRSASLDFLYQYTAIPENVDVLLKLGSVEGLTKQLTRLLLHGARVQDIKDPIPRPVEKKLPEENVQEIPIPRISQDHIDLLLEYEEPARSTAWLKACFEEDPAGEITQIALWQAYQTPFTAYTSTRPLLPAKDFITNVSQTFGAASAQVIQGTQPKFVIKGIKARHVPVDPRGKKFMVCQWHLEPASNDGDADPDVEMQDKPPATAGVTECGGFARDSKAMWEHIVKAHLGLSRSDSNGAWDTTADASRTYACRWAGCRHFDADTASSYSPSAPTPTPTPFAVGMHVKTHLPDTPDRAGAASRARHNRSVDALEVRHARARPPRTWHSRSTVVDERGEAAGLPLAAALALRNVAAGVPRTASALKEGDAGRGIVGRVFGALRPRLFEVLALNRALGRQVAGLIEIVDQGMALAVPVDVEAEGDAEAGAQEVEA